MIARLSKIAGPRTAALLCAAAVGLVASGCDIHEDADVDKGEQLFTEKCGACHTLKRAGSQGQIGPNLDAAFKQSRKDGMDQDTIEAVVERYIAFPQGDEMPANLVTGEDMEDVAAYVARWAGRSGVKPIGGEAAADPGGQVYLEQGCGSCHVLEAANSEGAVGPNLDESLSDNDRAFIEKQIVDPNSQLARGFEPGVMPENYEDIIDDAQLKALVKFIFDSTR